MNTYQQLIFLLERYAALSTVNTIAGFAHIRGRVEADVFGEALKVLAKQHPALRSKLVNENQLVIENEISVSFEVHEKFTDIENEIKKLTAKGILLSDFPLWKNTLLYTPDNETIWLLQIHHIIADGWAVSQVFQQVSTIYLAILEGKKRDDFELIAANIDKNTYVSSLQYEIDKAFWASQNIPFLSVSPQKISPTKRIYLPISPKYASALTAFCNQYQVEIPHLFLAILKTYFFRVYNDQHFLLGTPVLNRKGRKQRAEIDLFTNFLPLSFEINDKDTILAVAKRAKNFFFQLYKHQSFPYLDLLQQVRNQHDGVGKLFNVLFSYEKHNYGKTFANFDTTLTFLPHSADDNALTFHLMEYQGADNLTVAVDFSQSFFSEKEMESMLKSWQFALFQVLKNAKIGVQELQWTRQAQVPKHTIVQWIEKSSFNAQKIALVFQNQELSFEQLYKKAQTFVAYLKTLKNAENQPIAFCFKRGFEAPIAVLACLMANRPFLMMSPTWSEERKNKLMNTSKCVKLFDNEQFNRIINQQKQVGIFPFEWNDITATAYHIYTSGSTGEPKSIAILKAALQKVTNDWLQLYSLKESVILQLCEYTFDVFVGDIARSVLLNNTLVLTDENERISPQNIIQLIEKHKVTHLETTPAFSRLIAENIENQNINSLTHYIVGSDKFWKKDYEVLKLKLPASTKIINSYGLSECTIDSACYLIDNEGDISIPIGKSFPHQSLYILDRFLQPQPDFVEGELYIGGDCLGEFLNESDNQRFIFHEKFGKLYQTGDFGYKDAQHGITLTDRKDRQVKINAYRIELSEVEAALQKVLPQHQVAVIANPQLVAFISPDKNVEILNLKPQLSQFLPPYMIPTQFIGIENLPLNQNGKIDYQVLKTKETNFGFLEYIAPQTATETILHETLQKVLKNKQISMNAHFFELGGDSITAIQVQAQLMNCGYQLPISAFFEAKTLSELAQKMELISTENVESESPKHFTEEFSQSEIDDILGMLE